MFSYYFVSWDDSRRGRVAVVGEYGRWPNVAVGVRGPGALPQATVDLGLRPKFWGWRPAVGRVRGRETRAQQPGGDPRAERQI